MESAEKSRPILPPGHVRVPAAAIGTLAVLLAAGLGGLGFLRRIDSAVAGLFGGPADSPQDLSGWLVWGSTVLVAYGLAAAILSVPGAWRRLVLWITTLVVVMAWGPVLVLAAYAPAIAAPLIATVWSGVCAVVYAGNHRMRAEEISNTLPDGAH